MFLVSHADLPSAEALQMEAALAAQVAPTGKSGWFARLQVGGV
jgi:hypothetical protein